MAEHSHDHAHDHGGKAMEGASGVSGFDAGGRPMRVDAAARSLADALQVSFGLLKIVMVLLAIVYLGSGVFRVPAGYQAVKLFFGKVSGTGEEAIYDTGTYLWLPYPIGEVVLVDTRSQNMTISDAFWFETTEADKGKTYAEIAQAAANRPLNPEKDGSLITGDANVVLGKYEVAWKITHPPIFIEHVGLTRPEDEAMGLNDNRPLARAELMVRNAVERGIVYATAQTRADDYVKGAANTSIAMAGAQQILDSLRTGITIERLTAGDDTHPPPAVADAFNAASKAESRKAKLISDAEKDAATILSEAAGAAGPALIALIDRYERAVETKDTEQAEQLRQQIDAAFDARAVETVDPATDQQISYPIGGQVSQRLNEARGYANQIAKSIEAEALEYSYLHDRFRDAPEIFVHRLWQDTREAVLKGDVEVIYADTDNLRLDTQTDPQLKRARQQRTLEQAREAAKNQK